MHTNLVWFRNDLRIRDNPALYTACQDVKSLVIAIYIATPKQWETQAMSPKQALFIFKNLLYLKKKLGQFGITLYYHSSENFLTAVSYLIQFCIQHKVNNVFINCEYPIYERRRDLLLKKKLLINKIYLHEFHGNMLVSPETIKKKNGDFYHKYFAFKKCLIHYLKIKKNHLYSIPQKKQQHNNKTVKISSFEYPTETFNEILFPIGEEKALLQLKNFCKHQVSSYNYNRNYPSLNATSGLSAHLSIGVLSIRQCLFHLIKIYPNVLYLQEEFLWINELIWREFFYYLIASFPYLSQNKPFLKWTLFIPWNDNTHYFNAWKKGQTGFPIVDAGMRQLNSLGWMHNRLRMITASFLVKNLLIDWKQGQKYFMS
ncbi:deoxyribodipyrimidine photo-lyase, partial [Buchnera aphidicola (Hormaphis cornu)]